MCRRCFLTTEVTENTERLRVAVGDSRASDCRAEGPKPNSLRQSRRFDQMEVER